MERSIGQTIFMYACHVVTVVTFVIALIVLFPTMAFAQESTIEQPPDLTGFWDAIGSRSWPLAVAIGLMVVVWICRNFVMIKIPKKVFPWVALALAVVGTSATRMIQSISANTPWWHGMVQGILEGATVGFVAMGWWDAKQTVVKRESE